MENKEETILGVSKETLRRVCEDISTGQPQDTPPKFQDEDFTDVLLRGTKLLTEENPEVVATLRSALGTFERRSVNLFLEDLTAFAFIKKFDDGDASRFLSFNVIEKFGKKIVKTLEEKGYEAKTVLSRKDTEDFFIEYSDYFMPKTEDGVDGVFLKYGKTRNDLIERFSGCLAVDVLKSLASTSLEEGEVNE